MHYQFADPQTSWFTCPREPAIKRCRQTVEDESDFGDAWTADILEELGLTQLAATHFRRYLTQVPDSEWAVYARGRLRQIG